MRIEKYLDKLRKLTTEQSFTEENARKVLDYARKLLEQNLPIVFDINDLAQQTGFSNEYIFRILLDHEQMYKIYYIPKNDGKKRKICEPLPGLKDIHRWILTRILAKKSPSKYAKAYRTGYSIKANARFHCRQKYVLKMDIKDFFPSVHFPRVYTVFRNFGYSKRVSSMLANLCLYKDGLPQGAPTSPALSNHVLYRLDKRIAGYVIPRDARYTRYADDITISGNIDISKIIQFVSHVIEDEGFRVNEKKTRCMSESNRQIVTGIVVNRRMNITREQRRKFRQEVHIVNKYGLLKHSLHFAERPSKVLARLLGEMSFFISVIGKPKYIEDSKTILLRFRSEINTYDEEYAMIVHTKNQTR